MLFKAKTLKGYKLDGLDGAIGEIKEFYFDELRKRHGEPYPATERDDAGKAGIKRPSQQHLRKEHDHE